jgi:glycosyltransferase involved in cell wall biosynthesis
MSAATTNVPRDRVFLTWEHHRRSENLAHALGAEYVVSTSKTPYLFRVLWLAVRTFFFLLVRRPRVLIVQNPSQALAAAACLYKPLLDYTLVVDRHSNFKQTPEEQVGFKYWVFHKLSRWSVRHSDLTIVTNQALVEIVESWGGRGEVLTDKLPRLSPTQPWPTPIEEIYSAVFIASYDTDEPLQEMLEAVRRLPLPIRLFITGNYRRAGVVPPADLPQVTFTGFINDATYEALLRRVDVVIVLTSEENLLNCGSYEAVALGKPMILSGSRAIRSYFRQGVLYVDNTVDGIGAALRAFPAERERLEREVPELRQILEREWPQQHAAVERRIAEVQHG